MIFCINNRFEFIVLMRKEKRSPTLHIAHLLHTPQIMQKKKILPRIILIKISSCFAKRNFVNYNEYFFI